MSRPPDGPDRRALELARLEALEADVEALVAELALVEALLLRVADLEPTRHRRPPGHASRLNRGHRG